MMIALLDHDIKTLVQISELSCLLNAYGCEIAVYYEQNKAEIIQSTCKL